LGKGLSKVFALFLFLMHQVLSSLVRFLQELTKDESGLARFFGGKGLSKVKTLVRQCIRSSEFGQKDRPREIYHGKPDSLDPLFQFLQELFPSVRSLDPLFFL
jgi:hypothetical protein